MTIETPISDKQVAPSAPSAFVYKPGGWEARFYRVKREYTRFLVPALCVLLPLVFFFCIFQRDVKNLVRAGFDGSPISIPATAIAGSCAAPADPSKKVPLDVVK